MESLDELIEDYLSHYTNLKTLGNKRRHLTGFAEKLAAARLPLSEVTLSFVEQHLIDEARGKKWQKTTLRSAQIELRLFLRRAYHLGLIPTDFTEQIRISPSPSRALQYFYTVEESQQILEAAKKSTASVNRAIHLALLSGLRRGDIVKARGEHLRQDGERFLLHLPERKGGTSSTISLPEVTAKLLPRQGKFVTCSPSHLNHLVSKLGEDIGLDVPLRLHSLRASFITHALDAGVSERDAMLAAGHQRITTTAYYDQGYKTARLGVGEAVEKRIWA